MYDHDVVLKEERTTIVWAQWVVGKTVMFVDVRHLGVRWRNVDLLRYPYREMLQC